MSHDEETVSVYDEQAGKYLEVITKASDDPTLADFLKRLPAGGRVLDLGCGPGHYASAMCDAGYNVTATDASSVMVELTGKNKGLNVYQSTFEDLDKTQIYDGIWANFSLLHASQTDFPKHLKQIASALKPSGVFHIGMKVGTDGHRDSLGRYYSYYSIHDLTEHLNRAGLIVDNETTGEGTGLSGSIEPWVVLQAVKS